AQHPRPPSILGAAGPQRTPRLAARFADEFNLPFHPLDAAPPAYGRVRDACEASGRDPASMTLSAALTICCGKDKAEVERRAARIGRPPEHIDVAGTPTEVVDKLGEWHDAGASRIYFQVLDLDDPDH